jgi:hypothetical protein
MHTVFNCSNTGIVGSNPTRGMDAWCMFAYLLCCLVQDERMSAYLLCCLVQDVHNAFGWADLPSTESTTFMKDSYFQKLVVNGNRPESLILKKKKKICYENVVFRAVTLRHWPTWESLFVCFFLVSTFPPLFFVFVSFIPFCQSYSLWRNKHSGSIRRTEFHVRSVHGVCFIAVSYLPLPSNLAHSTLQPRE